jgi:hypothetical protein
VEQLEKFLNLALVRMFGTSNGERRVWVHMQNLNEDKSGEVKGPPLHGRAWLKALMAKGRAFELIRVEWVLPSSRIGTGVGLDLGDGETLTARIALPPVALYFGFGLPRIIAGAVDRMRLHHWDIFDVSWNSGEGSIDGGFLMWSVWHDQHSWTSGTPKWRHGSFCPRRLILGNAKHLSRDIESVNVNIPMPEGNYPAVVTLKDEFWDRPRWPFPVYVRRANVKLPVPIPHEGKGENSWDCGPDAIHGMTCPANNVEDAIAAVVQSVLRNRRRYDGDIMRQYPKPEGVAP